MLSCIHIRKKLKIFKKNWTPIVCIVFKNPYKKFLPIKIKFLLKQKQKLDSLSHDTCINKIHIIRFLILLLPLKNIHFIYIIILLDSFLKGLQEFPICNELYPLKWTKMDYKWLESLIHNMEVVY